MGRLKEWIRHISIRERLIAYFLLAILLPTMVITFFLYARTTRIITEKTNQLVGQNLESVGAVISQKLNLMNDLITLVNVNPTMQDIFMSKPPVFAEQIIHEISTLDNLLAGYFLSSSYLYATSGLSPRIYMLNRECYQRLRSDSPSTRVYDVGVIENEDWYKSLSSQFTFLGLNERAGLSIRTKRPVLQIARKLFNTKKNANGVEVSAILVMDVDVESFLSSLLPYRQTEGSQIFVTDSEGTILLGTDISRVGEQLPYSQGETPHNKPDIRRLNGENWLITGAMVDRLNWHIYSQVPMEEISGDQHALDRTLIILVAACMAVALTLALMLSKSIARPILKLVNSMEKVSQDDTFRIDIDYQQKDEFGYLIGKYKDMIREIQELIQRLYISDLTKKEAELAAKDAELKALQAQINPHFLYNALDSINLYAIRHKVPEISNMITALADFFRYGLSRGRDIITVQDELTIVESYLKIQKMRFGERISYQIDVPQEVRMHLIAKFTLQPLVENAVIHGIKPSCERVNHIVIRGGIDGKTLTLYIEDNGVGANVLQMHEMLADTDPESGRAFGIRNVHQRLQTLFGDDAGLRFEQAEAGGIIAVITLPSILTMEVYHAKNDRS